MRHGMRRGVLAILLVGCGDDGAGGAETDEGSSSSGTTTSSTSAAATSTSTSQGSTTTDTTTTGDPASSGSSDAGGSTGSEGQSVAVVVGYGARRVSSVDGETWENFVEVDAMGGDDNNLLRGVAFGGGAFLAVGGAQEGVSFSSSDGGITWDNENRDLRTFLSDAVYFDGEFVAAGGNGLRVHSGDLGVTWEDDAGFEMGHFRALATDGTTIVAVGNTYGGLGLSSTSTDGVGWSELDEGGQAFRDIAWGADVFVAVGNAGRISRSPDGATWEDASVGPADLRTVLFVDGTFYVDDMDRYWTSEDGEMWTEMELAGARPLAGFFEGRYFSTGPNGRIGASEDLTEWAVVFEMEGSAMTAMAVGVVP